MSIYYAGIGSRNTPKEILKLMTKSARIFSNKGWILRSGGAKGADNAFEIGSGNNKEIFHVNDCEDWCLEEVQKFVLASRDFSRFKPYTQKLLGRNMKQILGKNKTEPVSIVICWTPTLDYWSNEVGGTGYAIRCAMEYKIPIINLFDETSKEKFENIIMEQSK